MTPEPPDLPSPPVAEALATDAVGAHVTDAPRQHVHSAGNSHCRNCGTKLTGPFCSACGQHDFDFHRSFAHVFMEALENIFHFDGKFFRNLVTLLFRPGRLTADFNDGRRASQVPPFRLYIFTAFVFFLLLVSTNERGPAVQMSPAASTAASSKARSTKVNEAQTRVDLQPHESRPAADAAASPEAELESATVASSASEASQADTRAATASRQRRVATGTAGAEGATRAQTNLDRWIEQQVQRTTDPQFQTTISQRFMNALPKMLLVCVPVFALFTRVLFRRSGQVYLQHLVLALHFHTFIFIFVMFRDGWALLASTFGLGALEELLLFAANSWMTIYPVLMLRRLFGNSWPKTILKSLLLGLGYGAFLALAFFATAVVLFLMM